MLAIEFCVEKPRGGIRFIPKRPFNTTDPLDTYLCTVDHNSFNWFPCVNSYSEGCTWKIEILVEEQLSVIASGNLIEVENMPQVACSSELSPELTTKSANFKKYHYFLQVPTCAANIGLVIGKFESMIDENLTEVMYYYDGCLKSLVKQTCSFLHELFEFYEETFSTQFPYGSYKQVFLPDISDDFISFSSLTIIK